MEELGPSDPGTPFAADPAGRRLALVRSGELVLVGGGGAVKRLGGLPRAIAFSAGSRLAASFPAGPDSELRLYSPDGALEATARVPGALSSLAWLSDGEVAGGAATLERFSFGATRTEYLVRWTGTGEPSRVQTGSTTVKPLTMARAASLAENKAREVKAKPEHRVRHDAVDAGGARVRRAAGRDAGAHARLHDQ